MPISLDRDAIAAFCRRHYIRKLSLFGSVLTDRFTAGSDVDMLVEFEREHIPGLFGFVRMEEELSQIVGRKVDLRTAEDLSRYFREEVVAGAEAVYAP
ncbi:MAG: nucleotidyltransferase domain-containing protein [Verrucomicrobia bacterium]|nr:nucleotidyltransferase domain-containing protein [Verrucomicrobiota bacterium]